MAWSNEPAAIGDDFQAWDTLIQFWYALAERARAAGNPIFPHSSTPYGQGIVPSGITATGFTDANANDGAGWGIGVDNPWMNVATDTRLTGGVSWVLIIDDCDYRKVIRTNVVSNTEHDLVYDSFQDILTAGYISSLSDIEGKHYYFLREDTAVWWNERLLEFPNDREYASGTITQYFDDPDNPLTATQPTTSSIQDKSRAWKVNEHVGRDMLTYSGGVLRRVTITANTQNVLTFAAQSWTADSSQPYIVVAHNGKAYPGKTAVDPFVYYRGYMDSGWGYYPIKDGSDHYARPISVPAVSLYHPNASFPDPCTSAEQHASFDVDYFTAFDPTDEQIACSYPIDKTFAKDFWKTIRAIQVGCEDLSVSYVENKSYEGLADIPLMTPATLLLSAGLNSFTTTVSSVDHTGHTTTIPSHTFPYYPIDVLYTVLDVGGNSLLSGTVTVNSATQLAGDMDDSFVGKDLVISLGWTRYRPREVRRMFYGKTYFVPSEDGGGGVILPPDTVADFLDDGCGALGIWKKEPKSSGYLEHGLYGNYVETTAYVSGEYARYVGDNWGDLVANASDATRDYIQRQYTGQFSREIQPAIDAQRSGKTTATTSFSITDDTKHWFDPGWYSGGIMRTDSGTASGGSTTTLTDSSKTNTNEFGCFYDSGRFLNFSGPYEGFTIEIEISGVWYKRLITACSISGSQVSFSWSGALPSTASGKPYRIYEPLTELNRWQDHSVVIVIDASGSSVTVPILGNDDNTLFFADLGYTPDEKLGYAIIENKTGGVWKYNGSSWDPTSGADATRVFVPTPHNFVNYQPGNLPTYVKDYGRIRRGDDIVTVLNQLYLVLNKLKKTRVDVTWTNDKGDGPEDNYKGGSVFNDENGNVPGQNYLEHNPGEDGHFCELTNDDYPNYWTDPMQGAIHGGVLAPLEPQPSWGHCALMGDSGNYVDATPSPSDGIAPFSWASGQVLYSNITNPAGGAGTGLQTEFFVQRLYAYAKANVFEPYCTINKSVYFYCYTTIDSGDHDEGGYCVGNDLNDTKQWWEFTFKAGGDDVLFRQFHLWSTSSSDASTVVYSGSLGIDQLDTPPDAVDEPVPGGCFDPNRNLPDTPHTGDNERYGFGGYFVQKAYGVVDWSFTYFA